jgi:hypothetical protein
VRHAPNRGVVVAGSEEGQGYFNDLAPASAFLSPIPLTSIREPKAGSLTQAGEDPSQNRYGASHVAYVEDRAGHPDLFGYHGRWLGGSNGQRLGGCVLLSADVERFPLPLSGVRRTVPSGSLPRGSLYKPFIASLERESGRPARRIPDHGRA